jgi:hypothetical protein
MRFARSLLAIVAVSAVIGGVAAASEQRAILPESVRPYLVGGLVAAWLAEPPAPAAQQSRDWTIAPVSLPEPSINGDIFRLDPGPPPSPSVRAKEDEPRRRGVTITVNDGSIDQDRARWPGR